MMSIRNIALFAISDPLGSRLYSRYHVGFKQLVWLNAGATAAVLLFVPRAARRPAGRARRIQAAADRKICAVCYDRQCCANRTISAVACPCVTFALALAACATSRWPDEPGKPVTVSQAANVEAADQFLTR